MAFGTLTTKISLRVLDFHFGSSTSQPLCCAADTELLRPTVWRSWSSRRWASSFFVQAIILGEHRMRAVAFQQPYVPALPP